ncbi:MAG: phosphate ABC transporter permease PstA [Cyanobacteriota bacterium]|nr:phosphate ABC transporter permease PstA [Cyanobacteriota bacterium]
MVNPFSSPQPLSTTRVPLPLGSPSRHLGGTLPTCLSLLCLGLTLAPLVAILGYLGRLAWSGWDPAIFRLLPPAVGMSGGGIGNALLGTLILVGLATGMSLPLGILTAVYLSEGDPQSLGVQSVRLAVQLLSGMPSIMAGLLGYGLFVLTTRQFSGVAGGFALALIMLPLIIQTTTEALASVPDELRWASLASGASPMQTLWRVVMPVALPPLLTGITLAMTRAAGETAPLLLTALFSYFWPQGIGQPMPSLAVLIYNFAGIPFPRQQELAAIAALVLVGLALLVNSMAQAIIWQGRSPR